MPEEMKIKKDGEILEDKPEPDPLGEIQEILNDELEIEKVTISKLKVPLEIGTIPGLMKAKIKRKYKDKIKITESDMEKLERLHVLTGKKEALSDDELAELIKINDGIDVSEDQENMALEMMWASTIKPKMKLETYTALIRSLSEPDFVKVSSAFYAKNGLTDEDVSRIKNSQTPQK